MHKFLFVILSFLAFNALAQSDTSNIWKHDGIQHQASQFQNLNYRTQIEHSQLYMNDLQSIHSSVKPIITIQIGDFERSRFNIMKAWNSQERMKLRSNYFSVFPLTDFDLGLESGQKTSGITTAGLGAGMNFSSNKFILTANFLPFFALNGQLEDSVRTNYDQNFGTNRSFLNENIFYKTEIRAAYIINRFFTISAGQGKNFFGEGYRSLLLSDNAAPNPFLKIETSFAGIKYVNLYNAWKNNTVDPFNNSLDINKFSSLHYISWNITRDINLSVFEAVVWQAKDTLANRGFDFNYINPIVFYRPVEYGLGSSDNVLLGTNLSYKINKNHNIYTQFVLDEFLLSELQANSKWWANKYGLQLGYKSDRFFADNLYFQLEFNGVRPFTYSHKSSAHAYGNLNSSVTHPIGANFLEVLNIVSYKKGKHRMTNKITYASYGTDADSTISNGQNIFASYSLRDGNYDHLVMQGIRHNVLNETFIYELALLPKINLYLTAVYNWRFVNTSFGNEHIHTFSVGLKSRIWNSYSDF